MLLSTVFLSSTLFLSQKVLVVCLCLCVSVSLCLCVSLSLCYCLCALRSGLRYWLCKDSELTSSLSKSFAPLLQSHQLNPLSSYWLSVRRTVEADYSWSRAQQLEPEQLSWRATPTGSSGRITLSVDRPGGKQTWEADGVLRTAQRSACTAVAVVRVLNLPGSVSLV